MDRIISVVVRLRCMEEKRFCTKCGADLPEGSSFCPECGAPVNGGEDYDYSYNDAPRKAAGAPGYAVIILIYGILALIFGAIDAINGFSFTEASYQELIDMLTEIGGIDASQYMPAWNDAMPIRMGMSMVFLAVSGILAIGCYWMLKIKKNWMNSLILCAASSFACLGMACSEFYLSFGIVLFVIGIVFTVLVYTSKDRFAPLLR